MNSWLARRLGQVWCWIWTGHHLLQVRDKWKGRRWHVYLACSHCGWRTPGWFQDLEVGAAMTSHEIEQAFSELMDAELDLHCGG